jgi:hypothetical protein
MFIVNAYLSIIMHDVSLQVNASQYVAVIYHYNEQSFKSVLTEKYGYHKNR